MQTTVQTFNMMGNKLVTLPDQLYSMKSLKVLDLSNNKIAHISEALGNA
jgi:Leucine-rich repeat (LRR) protein